MAQILSVGSTDVRDGLSLTTHFLPTLLTNCWLNRRPLLTLSHALLNRASLMEYVFAGYTFDTESGLQFAGRAIALPPKERELLSFLVHSNGRIVSKDQVVRAVWHGGVASDESISRAVYRLRLSMQAAGGPPVVSTVYNGGFRISAPIHVRNVPVSLPTPTPTSTPALGRIEDTHLLHPMVQSSREFAARLSARDLTLALRAANAAVTLDPAYVPGWQAIGEFHILQAMRWLVPSRQAGQQALLAAERALALDPKCGAALAIRGWVRSLVEGDLQAGMHDLNRALGQDPSSWLVCHLHAWVLQAAGACEEALAAVQRAQSLNPYSLYIAAAVPQYLMYAGQLDAALASALELARQFPSLDSVHEVASILLSVRGRLVDALLHAQRAAALGQGVPLMQGQLAYVLARLEREDEVRRVLHTMTAPGQVAPHTALALVHMGRGDRRGALQCLREAKLDGMPQFFGMRDDPRFASVALDADFQALWHA